ncbi:MAG TPA: glycosyltransferase family 87 protein [Candidatus Cybelea sp.]|nr:glycosyltransferase family 87 protein [Candidatus Cybelea sp.]
MSLSSTLPARASWFGIERVIAYSRVFVALYAIAIIVWLALSPGLVDPKNKPIGTDFMDVWAAGRLALDGEPAAAYDYARHYDVQMHALPWHAGEPVPFFGWHYPPMFLLPAAALAMLPYGIALLLWMAATLPAYLAVARAVLPARFALLSAFAFPGTFVNLGHGQNGFLTAGLLGGGLLLLERRPWLAGALFGLLAYKPQFGVLIPLALVAARQWRAIGGACATLAVTAFASYAVFGRETWSAFFASAKLTRTIILEQGATGWPKIQSAFAAVRMLGGEIALAYAVQGVTTILAATAVVWIWRRDAAMPLKGAALATATLLATPYVLDYDLMLLALPLAWIAMAGVRDGFLPWERPVLAAAWLLPILSRSIGSAVHVPVAPLVLLLLLAAILRRSMVEKSAA